MTEIRKAAKLLQDNDRFLILTHRRPDGDTIGSAAGLCAALRSLGKTAYTLSNPEITDKYMEYMTEYTASAEYEPAFIIAVDTAAPSMIPVSAAEYADRIDLCIDHHASVKKYAKTDCIMHGAAACGEVVYTILTEAGVKITAQVALPLYVAISTDTGCFSYSNTTADSHRIAAALFETGIAHEETNKKLFNTKSRTRFDIERHMLDTMEYFDDGTIAICWIPRNMVTRIGASADDLDEVANLPRQIEGVDAGITIKEGQDGMCKLSVRTSEKIDAAAACSLLGGGGHVRAAGCSFDGDFTGARNAILDAIRKTNP